MIHRYRAFLLGIAAFLGSTAFPVSGIDLIRNGDFSVIEGSSAPGWSPARNWKGKSIYRAVKGCIAIERNDDDGGAGAYFSAPIPVNGGTKYDFSVKFRCTLNKKGSFCTASAIWTDAQGKSLPATYLFQTKKTTGETAVSKQIFSPAKAVSVRLRLVLGGIGSAEFFRAAFHNNFQSVSNDGKTIVENLLPHSGWKEKTAWKGKSVYKTQRNTFFISRPEADDGAGAWESAPVNITGKKFLFAGGEIKTTDTTDIADITLHFYDAHKKRISSQSLISVRGSTDWKKAQRIIEVPVGSKEVRVLMRLFKKGDAAFRNIFLSGKVPETSDNRDDAPFLLNGSFEKADLSPGFTDCFVPVTGKSRRTQQAFHGFHALELDAASSAAYGKKDVPAVSVRAGDKLHFSFAAAGAGKAVCILDFRNGHGRKVGAVELACTPGSGKYRQVQRALRVPAQAVSAALTLYNRGNAPVRIDALYLGKKSFSAKKTPTVPVIAQGPDADSGKFPRSTIKMLNGRPTWYINGQAQTQAAFTLSSIRSTSRPPWYNYVRKVLRHGNYPLVLIECHITPEHKGEKYTFETVMRDIDVQVRSTLAEIPDAKFMLWVFLEPSTTFASRHPDELTRLEDQTAPRRYKIPAYSFGSEIWARQCQYALRELLARVSKLPYAGRIAAVSPGLGQCGENNFELASTHTRHSPQDFSPAMKDFFSRWLMREYGGNVMLFKKAWNQEGVFNFTNAQVPSMMRRVPKEKGAFYDPATQKQNIDYVRCESFSILHRVLQMCQTVKEVSGGRLFTMAQLAYFTNQILHLELKMALESPHLDAFGPAPPYINRGPGDDIMDHGPAESVSSHGKLWMFQADVRSHLASAHNWKYGRTGNEKESVAIYLRDIGHYMTRGQVPYYMNFEPWYNSPGLFALISRFNGWLELGAKFPRPSNAEIAVVVDHMSLAAGHEYSYVRRIMPPNQSSLEYNRTFEWHHLGAPYDFFMLDDLLKHKDISQYKTIIFAVNWAISSEQRDLIKKRLKKDGRTLVWIYAPGIIWYDKNDLKYSIAGTKITGFDLVLSEKMHNLEITLADGRKAGRFNTKIYGGFRTPRTAIPVRPETFAPRLSVTPGKDIEIIGVYTEDQAPAAAVRKTPTHTDVFWGSTALNKEVLVPILKKAGVHLYTDKPAVVYASENVLAIHSPTAGKREIRLPRKVEVIYNLFSNRVIATDTDRITVTLEKNATILLYYGKRTALMQTLTEVETTSSLRKQRNDTGRKKYQYSLPEKKPVAKKAETGKLYSVDQQGFIRHWQIAGPFPNYERKQAFNIDFLNGEDKAVPRNDAVFTAVFDATSSELNLERMVWFNGKAEHRTIRLKWHPIAFSKGRIAPLYDEINIFPFFERIAYYAFCRIISSRECSATLAVGSDDGNKTWFNGNLCTRNNAVSRSIKPDSEKAQVTIKKGVNTLLIKVLQGQGGLGHCVRFLDASGKPLTDLKIQL
ncbi:MAG: hypothetical protein IKC65_05815 [Lentisphaeria bacterium]|nr:hypothetical protein [Lentisphaeria bacterium]